MHGSMNQPKKLYSVLIALAIAHTCAAQTKQEQEEEMDTDRPTQTESAATLKQGTTQLETGFLFNYFDDEQTTPAYIGRALLRYGITNRVEARLLIEDGKNRDVYITETVQSTYPLALSTKISLVEQHSWLPDISLVTYLKLPFTSRSEAQTAYWSPAVIGAFKNKLSQLWEVEYNVGIMQEAYDRSWNWLGNGELKYKASDKLSIFGEYFAQYESGEEPVHNAAAGGMFQCSKNMQLDIAGGTTINASKPNAFITLGYSVRF